MTCQTKKRVGALPEPEGGTAGGAFPDRAAHRPVLRCEKRALPPFEQPCRQNRAALTYDYFAVFNFYGPPSQISRQPVFLSPPHDHRYNSGETEKPHGYVRNAEHDRPVAKIALRPRVLFREGTSPVTFYIAYSVVETVIGSVYPHIPGNRMFHAQNAVPAFHKREKAERPHDVVPYRGKLPEPDTTLRTAAWCV